MVFSSSVDIFYAVYTDCSTSEAVVGSAAFLVDETLSLSSVAAADLANNPVSCICEI